jgi:hypothetical protein
MLIKANIAREIGRVPEVKKLREALEDIATTAHCIAKAGPMITHPDEVWDRFNAISATASQALFDSKGRTRELSKPLQKKWDESQKPRKGTRG